LVLYGLTAIMLAVGVSLIQLMRAVEPSPAGVVEAGEAGPPTAE